MKFFYDLHIHTCLSPCGDEDMTPNNIINMALIKGLDVIAITDHNCASNVRACCEVARDSELIVIPGMEVETSEEIHMVVLHENIDKLLEIENIVSQSLPPIKNKVEIFGEQVIMNSLDEVVGTKDNFLITASGIDVASLYKIVSDFGGVIFPAHIDKTSYSIISNLGSIPDDLLFSAVEIKNKPINPEIKKICENRNFKVIHNSDAHYLWDISERENYIECKSRNIHDFLTNLKQKNS